MPDVYSQVAEISNGESSQNVYYDDYGRVTEYVVTFRDETVKSTYTYISDDLIKIYTFVDIDAADVVEAVGELFEDEKMSAAAVKSEDV